MIYGQFEVIIAIIMANKIEGSEIFDVPAQPKGWQAHASVAAMTMYRLYRLSMLLVIIGDSEQVSK